MLATLLHKTQAKVASAKRTAIAGTVAVLACMVGLGFATAAGWIALSAQYDAIAASAIVAGVYFALGFIALLFGKSKPSAPVAHAVDVAPTPAAPVQATPDAMTEAFLLGSLIGKGLRGR